MTQGSPDTTTSSPTLPKPGLEAIGLGMSTLDVLIRLQDMPTWEHGTRVHGFRLEGGGPVGTAMVAAARLGARVGYIGTAGNDEAARIKLQSMHDAGVDLSRLRWRDAPEDQIVFVYVHSDTGERQFAGLQRWGESQLRVEELERDYITSAKLLHLDGYHSATTIQAAQWMREAGGIVMLDGSKTNRPVRGPVVQLIEYVDVLISGSGFMQGLTGKTDVWDACEAALQLGPSIAVQTEGVGGSYTVTSRERFHTPAFQCSVIDTTGAGDVFHGAYIVGLLRGWTPRQTAQFATAVSALKCGKLGGRAGIPTFDETMTYLTQQGINLDALS